MPNLRATLMSRPRVTSAVDSTKASGVLVVDAHGAVGDDFQVGGGVEHTLVDLELTLIKQSLASADAGAHLFVSERVHGIIRHDDLGDAVERREIFEGNLQSDEDTHFRDGLSR